MHFRPGELASRAMSGMAWSGTARVAQEATFLLTIAILARVLGPRSFGLVGMAMVITGFVTVFRDLGTSSALIQREQISDELATSAFWFNVLLGLGLTALLVGASPLLASFYRQPEVAPVLAVLSLSLLLSSPGAIPQALAVRDMAFDRLARVEVMSAFGAAAVAVTAAILGAGVWSLVALRLMQAGLTSMLLLLSFPWRPAWPVNWRTLRAIRAYSLNLTGFNIFNYFARNADDLLIGRYLGATALGYYTVGYRFLLYPVQAVSGVIGRVLFPAFSRIQADDERFREAYLRLCGAIALITFPAMIAVFLLAEPLVLAVLGARWLPIVPLVLIFSLLGGVQSVGTTVGQIYLAKGRTDWLFRWGIVAGSLLILSFVIGLRWGVIGVAAAYALTSGLVLLYPNFAIPFRLIGLSVRELAAAVWPAVKYSLLMGFAVVLVRLGLGGLEISSPWMVVSAAGLTGAVVYSILLIWRKPPAIRDVAALLPLSRIPWMHRAALRLRLLD